MQFSQVVAPIRRRAKYDRLIARAKKVHPRRRWLCTPARAHRLRGRNRRLRKRALLFHSFVFTAAQITGGCSLSMNWILERFEVVDAGHSEAAAAKAVQLVMKRKVSLLMKGSPATDELMRESEFRQAENGRRIKPCLSLVDVPSHSEALFINRCAINIFFLISTPKRDIIHTLRYLFALAASERRGSQSSLQVETVTTKIPSTNRAWQPFARWLTRGQLLAASLSGRLLSDNAVDASSQGQRIKSQGRRAGHKFLSCRNWKPAICCKEPQFFLPSQIRLARSPARAFQSF